MTVKTGTLVDATIIASASEEDGDAHWVKHKGKPAVHGFKAHVGADADTALVEQIAVTPANINDGKAGRTRWRGKRPHNRGVTMNPVDHPHGGGEGRTSGGRHPVSPWGKPTKGKRTRSNKATDKFIVRSRHQRKS